MQRHLLVACFQTLDSGVVRQKSHLLNGDLVQLAKPLALRQLFPDEERVQVFQVGEADKLRHVGVISHIALVTRMAVPPLPGGHAKEGHVQHIRFAGIDEVGLRLVQLWRDEVGLDGIRVDAVVDAGEVAADVPTEGLTLGLLEALEFLDEVELELDRNPRGELERNVGMGVGAAVAPGFGLDADGARALDPLLRSQGEAVEPGLLSNPVEFDGIKIRVVDLLPDSEKLNGVAVAKPVRIRSSLAVSFL